MDIGRKRQEEKRMIAMMIKLYCRGKRHPAGGKEFCPRCEALLRYARNRIDHCPRMAEKTFCSRCPAPCYELARREEIRAVMRYAAPRLLLRRPIHVIKHMLTPGGKKSRRGRE